MIADEDQRIGIGLITCWIQLEFRNQMDTLVIQWCHYGIRRQGLQRAASSWKNSSFFAVDMGICPAIPAKGATDSNEIRMILRYLCEGAWEAEGSGENVEQDLTIVTNTKSYHKAIHRWQNDCIALHAKSMCAGIFHVWRNSTHGLSLPTPQYPQQSLLWLQGMNL